MIHPLRLSPLALLSLGAVSGIAVLVLSSMPIPVAFAGLAIIALGLMPSGIYALGWDRSPVPFFPLVSLYYVVFFGLPVFLVPLGWPDGEPIKLYNVVAVEPLRAGPVLLAAGGVGVMVLIFYGARLGPVRKLPALRLQSIDTASLTALYWILMAVHLAYRYVPALQSLPSFGQALEPAGYIAFGGLYLQWRRERLAKPQAWILLVICLPLELYWRTRYFFVTDILFFFLFFVFIFWRERRWRLLLTLVVLGALFTASYSITTVVRSGSDTFVGKLERFARAVGPVLREGRPSLQLDWGFMRLEPDPQNADNNRATPTQFEGRVQPLVRRVSQIWLFHAVDDASPVRVPYWNGESYRPLLTSFIPRALYPDKPREETGSKFGRRYGLLDESDAGTSVNVPWLTELLANFGHTGVLIGMGLFGVLLATLDRLLNAPGRSDPEFLIGAAILFRLVYPESNFTVMTGTLVPQFVMLYLYFTLGGIAGRRLARTPI